MRLPGLRCGPCGASLSTDNRNASQAMCERCGNRYVVVVGSSPSWHVAPTGPTVADVVRYLIANYETAEHEAYRLVVERLDSVFTQVDDGADSADIANDIASAAALRERPTWVGN